MNPPTPAAPPTRWTHSKGVGPLPKPRRTACAIKGAWWFGASRPGPALCPLAGCSHSPQHLPCLSPAPSAVGCFSLVSLLALPRSCCPIAAAAPPQHILLTTAALRVAMPKIPLAPCCCKRAITASRVQRNTTLIDRSLPFRPCEDSSKGLHQLHVPALRMLAKQDRDLSQKFVTPLP